jgi:hypothetical protein
MKKIMEKPKLKKLVLVFVWLMILTVYLITLFQSVQAYECWKQKYLQEHPDIAPYVDFHPFLATQTGRNFVVIGVLLALGSLFIPPIIAKGELNKLAMFFLGAIIAMGFLVPLVVAEDVVHVDILCVCDEEFDSGLIMIPHSPLPIYVPSKGWAQSEMSNIAEDFMADFSIQLHWHYWTYFDSDDGTYFADDRLNEAVNEVGWYVGKIVDDETMELMIVFTQQSMDMKGISLPGLRAIIVGATFYLENLMKHEIGHQFGLNHCQHSYCSMYGTFPPGVDYCDDCKAKLMANRYALVHYTNDPNTNSYKNNGGCAMKARPC